MGTRRLGAGFFLFAFVFCCFTVSVGQEDSVYDPSIFELGDGQPPPGMPGMADILKQGEGGGPDWASLFAATGAPRDDYPLDAGGNPLGNGVPDYLELYGGQWVVFTADDVSLGTGFEGTALAPDGRVQNAVAAAQHDIGNAYVYSTTSGQQNLVVFAGFERLGVGASHVEIELSQDHYRLGHGGFGRGEPWEVLGQRAAGDVLIRVEFTAEQLSLIEASSWDGQNWVSLSSVGSEGCDQAETLCAVCNSSSIDGGPWVNHDTDGDPEQIAPGRFVEVGVNIGMLMGTQPSFTTVRLRTPEDVAFGYFAEGK